MADGYQVLFGDDARGAASAFYQQLAGLEVEENANLPGAIQLNLSLATAGSSGSEDLPLVGDSRFQPYARISVVATPDGGRDACIFDGYVLSHKVHLDRGTAAPTLEVWGQDVSCLMNLKEVTKEWKQSDGNIAKKIIEDYGHTSAEANTQDDTPEHPDDRHTLMQRATDAQFLRDRARRDGRLFRVCCGESAGQNTGYFIKPKLDGSADVTLALHPQGDANVDSLDFEWDVARPTKVWAQVLVASKDAQKGDTEQSGLDLLDSRSLAAFAGSNRVMEARLTAPADSAEELKVRAASLLREAGWFVKCEGETDLARLRKVLRVGQIAQVNGAGRMHSGKYFIWSVRHTITAQAHRMRFVLVRNAIGNT